MAIQNSINSMLGTVAAGAVGVSHLAEMEKSNQMNAITHSESMSDKLVELANQGTEANRAYKNQVAVDLKAEKDLVKAENTLKSFNAEKKHRDEKGRFMSKEQSNQKGIVLQHDLSKKAAAFGAVRKETLAIGQQLQAWKARLEAFNKTDSILKNQRGYVSPDKSKLLTPAQTNNINQALEYAETSKKENEKYNKYLNGLMGGKK